MKKYSDSHEWVEIENEIATVGISHFAQKELGAIVYIEFPPLGKKVEAGDEAIVLESTKSAVDIYTPLSGEIIAVNDALKSNPLAINQSAEESWLFKVKMSQPIELQSLMDELTYKGMIEADVGSA